ncbi:dynein light chain Tctex-type protein 2B [Augochlora pura]
MEEEKDEDLESIAPEKSKNEIKEKDDSESQVEKIEETQETQVNLEVLEVAEPEPAEQPVYQIRPQLHEKFKPLRAKEVIHNILFDQLSTKVYDAQEAIQWTKDIADIIREKVKELNFKSYKYLVNVVLGEQHGAGVKMGTRCIWDAEADAYAYDSFVNDTIFCVATVYAVYFY